MKTFDVNAIRSLFPILSQPVREKSLAYLDNAASAQKPQSVIDTIEDFYEMEYANVHRGLHYLSEKATNRYESARIKVKEYLNARSEKEIVFVRGTTEAINLVASTYGVANIGRNDEILISAMEHHSNIVPWQMLCERTGAKLKVIPMNEQGELMIEEYEILLNPRTKLVALTHVANAIGTINPVKEIITLAHAHGIPVLLDGAQAIPHMPVDVQSLDVDFYAFSGHKAFGPSGIGVLYAKLALLDAMPPYQGGGEMIRKVTFEKSEYAELPYKFEAGTPNIAGAVGLGATIDFLNSIDWPAAQAYEESLLSYGLHVLSEIPQLRLIGTAREKASVLSFIFEDIHAHDVGTIVDTHGVAVRSGHHCAMPVMQFFDVPATVRASLAFYNTQEEIDQLVTALYDVRKVFAK